MEFFGTVNFVWYTVTDFCWEHCRWMMAMKGVAQMVWIAQVIVSNWFLLLLKLKLFFSLPILQICTQRWVPIFLWHKYSPPLVMPFTLAVFPPCWMFNQSTEFLGCSSYCDASAGLQWDILLSINRLLWKTLMDLGSSKWKGIKRLHVVSPSSGTHVFFSEIKGRSMSLVYNIPDWLEEVEPTQLQSRTSHHPNDLQAGFA